MPRLRRSSPFYLVVKDDDRKEFFIVGPITNDTAWNKKVIELQNQGRKVSCCSGNEGSKENIVKFFEQQYGYRFTSNFIIDDPEDKSMEYGGNLPKYAQRADRMRVVKILCKSEACGKIRLAEMTVNYPGQEILRVSNLGDYTAICLMCRKKALDSYNWYR